MDIDTVTKVLDIATSVVGTAAVIAAATPTPKDDNVFAIVKKVLDFLAFNFWNAKNR